MSHVTMDALTALVEDTWSRDGYGRKFRYLYRPGASWKRCCGKWMTVVYKEYVKDGQGKYKPGSRGYESWQRKSGWKCEDCGYEMARTDSEGYGI